MPEQTTRIDWPPQFDRTADHEREPNNSFDVTLARAFSDLETELDRLGVDDYDYEFDAQQRKKDKRPYSRANSDDPSFVLRWSMGGEQYAVACDRYSRLRDNVRTVGHYLNEKRKMEDRPVETGESEFANARLPPGEGEDSVVVAGSASKQPHEVLGVDPDAPDAVVRGAYRELLKERHPDHGGTEAEFRELQEVKEAMLDDA